MTKKDDGTKQSQLRDKLRDELKTNINWDTLQIREHRPWHVVTFETEYTALNHKVVVLDLWGVSKICWPDKWDAERGENMAINRALGWAVSEIIPPLEE